MTILYDFYSSPKISGKEVKSFHARVVSYKTVSTDQVIADIHERCSLTPGDIKSALTGLSESIAKFLKNGDRVHLEGIGYFQITLGSTTEIDPKKTKAHSLYIKSIKYRADKMLNTQMGNAKIKRAKYKKHSSVLSHEDIDKLLKAFFSKNQLLFRRDLQRLCGFTRNTATRHINRLKEEGKIQNINTKYQPIYIPVPGNYGKP